MREALKEAEIALETWCTWLVVQLSRMENIGSSHNAREELQRAVMHAEIMAIENATWAKRV